VQDRDSVGLTVPLTYQPPWRTQQRRGPDCKTDAVIATNKESSAIIVFVEAARKLLLWKRQEYKKSSIPIVTEWDDGTSDRK
jgi:hypothetical protein